MSKRSRFEDTLQTPAADDRHFAPEAQHSAPDLSTPTPEIRTADPEAEVTRDQTEATPAGRPVVAWLGLIEPHSCPHCRTRLLGDRATKACVVTSTLPESQVDGQRVRDRKMKCLWCEETFVAREKF